MKVHIADDLASVAGPLLVEGIHSAISRRGHCRLGLSGGSTPGDTLGALASALPAAVYRALWVTWVDERHLQRVDNAPDWLAWHPDSNIRLAYERWLADAPHLDEQVLPMSRGGDLDEAAEQFRRGFAMYFQGGLDIALLGVGSDGHIASLFPGHKALESTDTVVSLRDSPKPPSERISLTLSVLENADLIVLLARGEAKADVLARAKAGDTSLPLGRFAPKGEVHWVVDTAAGAGL